MGTPPIRPHRRRYGDARMVVGKVRGRVGRDERGGRERVGGGRPMGQAIAVDYGLFFICYWVGRKSLGRCSEKAVKATMEGHGRIV